MRFNSCHGSKRLCLFTGFSFWSFEFVIHFNSYIARITWEYNIIIVSSLATITLNWNISFVLLLLQFFWLFIVIRILNILNEHRVPKHMRTRCPMTILNDMRYRRESLSHPPAPHATHCEAIKINEKYMSDINYQNMSTIRFAEWFIN